ncbi:MAG: phosphotransferase family protein [Desulfobacterales bacterium]|jgi:aminoglycoside phosphotransferase (APT) family kinase protein|nr:phosphotransferase family protein [Desulfobacterales bacterium]
MQTIDKNRPSPQWIESIRRRYVVEREIDYILTRKMKRRDGPEFSPLSLEMLVKSVASLIRSELHEPFEISDAKWMAGGGASKMQMAFTLTWNRPGIGRESTPMVLRIQPSESIVETSRLREFQLLRAFNGVVPVPPTFWCDEEAKFLPYPGFIYGFVDGVTKPTAGVSGLSGFGTQLSPELRAKLAPQFVRHLAKIHTYDFRKADLSAFDVPRINSTQCAEWCVNWWQRVWEEDSDEEIPLMTFCACWLRNNLPVLDFPSVVHADFRTGNYLYTEPDSRITAWLDWELGRIGDRHLDIAWTTSRGFGTLAEDRKTFLVSSLLPEAEFIDAYEQASGLRVNPKTVHWYKIFNDYMMATLLFSTGYRIVRCGKSHQDAYVLWLMGVGPMLLEEMRMLLEVAP